MRTRNLSGRGQEGGKPLMEFSGERVVLGATPARIVADHLARYKYAATKLLSLPELRVIDVGCGTGYGTQLIGRASSRAVGIDCSREAIAFASLHHSGPEFCLASADCLPFREAAFNAATCFELVEHVADARAVVAEISRVLQPGGVLVISTPNRIVTSHGGSMNPFHVREFVLSEFIELLEPHFAIVEMLGQRLRPAYWYGLLFDVIPTRLRSRFDRNAGHSTPIPIPAGKVARYFVVTALRT